MATLIQAARRARINAYGARIRQALAGKIIDISKPDFIDLVNDQGKPVSSLNGEIILERDFYPDGRLKGVISIHPDDLAMMLPDLKADVGNTTGWKKYLDKWRSEGIDVLVGVPDPNPAEYTET